MTNSRYYSEPTIIRTSKPFSIPLIDPKEYIETKGELEFVGAYIFIFSSWMKITQLSQRDPEVELALKNWIYKADDYLPDWAQGVLEAL